jgi:hypothetical protein
VKRVHAACALAVAVSAGCISFDVAWERVETRSRVAREDGYRLELPVGWARSGNWLTRDGLQLQAIGFVKVDAETMFPDGTPLDPRSPDLCAQLEAAALESGDDVRAVECEEVTLGGRRAVRLRFEGRFPSGFGCWPDLFLGVFLTPQSWWRHEIDWVEDPSGEMFLFTYGAPPLVYFERDLAAFEDLVASLEVDGRPAAATAPARATR